MHIGKLKERQGLSRLLGLFVAGTTLLTGMMILPAVQASADTVEDTGLAAEDNFIAGALRTDIAPQLTVTKYLSLTQGKAPHGSAIDATNAANGNRPGKDIVFNVHQVKPKGEGKTIADIDPKDPTTYDFDDTDGYYAGQTDGQGVISTWFKANTDAGNGKVGAPTSVEKAFPAGQHYYIMSENTDASPAFTNGTLNKAGYSIAANSLFGLPYKTTTPNGKTSGYIYHLHLYPKNVNNSSLTKVVTGIKDSAGKDVDIAKAGDVVSYKVDQKIYNEGASAKPNDTKLDVKEIQGDGNDIIIADRMGSSLSIVPDSIKVRIAWDGGSQNLTKDSDYTYAETTSSPKRLVDASKALFDGESQATYHVFNFFKNAGTVTGLVGASGSAAGKTELNVEVEYKATVTEKGDSSDNGGVINKVASDHRDNKTGKGDPNPVPTDEAVVPSGTVAFGKVEKDGKNGYKGLSDVVFRLASTSDPAKYLATDGKFYADGDKLPENVKIYSATSSKTGAVVFTGLPIIDRTNSDITQQTGVAGNWNIVEYTAPKGYNVPSIPFSQVVFGDDVAGKTSKDIITQHGRNSIEPDYNKLSFGKLAPSSTPSPAIQVHGNDVKKYLVNFKDTDTTSPVILPLTGGRGIILLLVVGLAVMIGVMYLRSRRKSAHA